MTAADICRLRALLLHLIEAARVADPDTSEASVLEASAAHAEMIRHHAFRHVDAVAVKRAWAEAAAESADGGVPAALRDDAVQIPVHCPFSPRDLMAPTFDVEDAVRRIRDLPVLRLSDARERAADAPRLLTDDRPAASRRAKDS